MVEKIKVDVIGLLLVLKINKSSILAKSIEIYFLLSKAKLVYKSVFIFSNISLIMKSKFYVFWNNITQFT